MRFGPAAMGRGAARFLVSTSDTIRVRQPQRRIDIPLLMTGQ